MLGRMYRACVCPSDASPIILTAPLAAGSPPWTMCRVRRSVLVIAPAPANSGVELFPRATRPRERRAWGVRGAGLSAVESPSFSIEGLPDEPPSGAATMLGTRSIPRRDRRHATRPPGVEHGAVTPPAGILPRELSSTPDCAAASRGTNLYFVMPHLTPVNYLYRLLVQYPRRPHGRENKLQPRPRTPCDALG